MKDPQHPVHAGKVTITGLRQAAYYTSAATFTLDGMRLELHVGGSHEYYDDED